MGSAGTKYSISQPSWLTELALPDRRHLGPAYRGFTLSLNATTLIPNGVAVGGDASNVGIAASAKSYRKLR